ncbi:copper-binding protein [Hydrogenophaga sp. OTU3427]|jgi:Cu/Ag efflux protein CusF|uniref:copper-binding protein n=1 Tax=Hydrogenophaga sp. OTU3427 TaxID=3043856 RepID=UPI00313BB600
MKKSIVQAGMLLALASGGLFPMLAQAQATMDHSKMDMAKMPSMTDGEVRKVDLATGKVTIKHGEIKHMDMPGMTMVFTAKDKALLTGLKVGDKVKFMAENANGQMLVTGIEAAK